MISRCEVPLAFDVHVQRDGARGDEGSGSSIGPFDREDGLRCNEVRLVSAQGNEGPVEGLTRFAQFDRFPGGVGIAGNPPQLVDREHTLANPPNR